MAGFLRYDELMQGGLGQAGIASVITGIIGPIAEAGASAYSTYATQDVAKRQLKAQQQEISELVAQRQREAVLQGEQSKVQATVDTFKAQLTSKNVAIGLGVLGAIGVGWLVFRAVRKKNPRRRGARRGR